MFWSVTLLYCFLDTNILMEYTTFDEVDWCKILDNDKVQLIITLDVIRELDKHKGDPKSARKSKRAQAIIKKLKHYENKLEVRKGVSLVLLQPPNTEWLRQNGFDVEQIDSRIIGTAKRFAEKQQPVTTVSNDYAFQVGSKAVGLQTVELPDSLLLPPEPDPLQKENQELKNELLRLKNAQPKLKLGFYKDETLTRDIHFSIDFSNPDLLKGFDRIIEDLRSKLRYSEKGGYYDIRMLGLTAEDVEDAALQGGSILLPPSPKEVNNYNNIKLENYLKEYRDYLDLKGAYDIYRQRTRIISMALENIGQEPAKDIDVALLFPKGLIIADHYQSEPKQPLEPEKPKPRKSLDLGNAGKDLLFIPFHRSFPAEQASNIDGNASSSRFLDIRNNGDSTRSVKFKLDKLKHYDKLDWHLIVSFEEPEQLPTGFEVEYKITAANIPDLLEGKLAIKISAL